MKTYYKTSTEYHDALDRREAQERAEQAERELNDVRCVCLEVIGDNGDCPVHGKGFEQAKAEYFEDYGADYAERNDLYSFAMGC